MGSITRKPRATPSDQRRPAIEAKLLEATEALLADGTPYTELSIQQLCSEAGIARSTFYVYFRDKSDLVVRLADSMVAQLAEAASAWWQPGADRATVHGATLALIHLYREHSALLAALTETAAYDAELRAVQVEMVERYARPLEELISERSDERGIREVPAHETVASLAWMLQGACYHLAPGASEAEVERLAEALTGIVWHSLIPDAPSEQRGAANLPGAAGETH